MNILAGIFWLALFFSTICGICGAMEQEICWYELVLLQGAGEETAGSWTG